MRRTLRDGGLRAQRRFSQNFLVDVDVLEDILAAADPGLDRRILEIGPGLGILTGGLLAAGARVTAVEIDRGMVAYLRDAYALELAASTLTLVEGDILDADLSALVHPPYDVVANLPYHVTSPVLHLLLGGTAGLRPERCVLMVQREVAERIAAPAGEMSYLSVFVQYHAAPTIVRRVPRAAFEPAPEVDSAILALDVRPPDAAGRLPPEMEDHLWRLVQAGFRERRKMLHNVLPRQLPLEPAAITAALESAGIAGDRRPQTLGVGEWIALLGALGPLPEDRRGRRAERAGRDGRDPPTPGGHRPDPATRGAGRPGPGGTLVSDALRRVSPVVRLAPAKLNLTLAVTGRREDGFHALHSVMVPLDLADRLALSPAFGPADMLHVTGPGVAAAPDLGPEQENLVLRAIRAARDAIRAAGDARPLPALAARLEKWIPPAAGLGGGSSDAAAALDGALEAWGAIDVLSPQAVAAIAASLGSDCPFFLAGGWALVEGRGERVTPLPAPRGEAPGVVLVTPSVTVSTPEVFARYAAGVRPEGAATLASSRYLAGELRAGLAGARFLERAGVLSVANDLAPATADLVPASRARPPRPRPAPRAAGGPVGLGSDAVGPLRIEAGGRG